MHWARHPLYVMEFVTLIGTAIQFAQPWAALLAAGVIVFPGPAHGVRRARAGGGLIPNMPPIARA